MIKLAKTKQIIHPIIVGLIIVLTYLASRLQHLTSIPVFVDEAIYVRWSQIIRSVETLRFIPLTDGKQPLFMWLMVPLFKLFTDPLFAGRFLSIFSGLGILISLAVISYTLTKSYRASLITALIYLLLPFTFFFDRLALADNLLSFWGTLALLLSFLQAKHLRLDLALILGGVLGFAYITKSPAIFFIILSASTTIFLNLSRLSQPKFLTKIIVFTLISSIISLAIYNALRLGPQFGMIATRNRDYVWPISEIIRHPLDPLKPHLIDVIHIYNWGIGLPLMALFLFALAHLIITQKITKENFILLAWWTLPLLANASLAKVFTARYILFTLPPLILLMSISVNHLFSHFPKITINYLVAIILLLSLPNILNISKLSLTPFNCQLPSTETGYLQGWTSGWGIKDSADFLIERSKVANVIVGTEGFFGTLPDGLQIYTNQLPQLTIVGVGVYISQLPPNLVDAKNHGDEVYLLLNQSRNHLSPEIMSKVTVVNRYPKPANDWLELIRL